MAGRPRRAGTRVALIVAVVAATFALIAWPASADPGGNPPTNPGNGQANGHANGQGNGGPPPSTPASHPGNGNANGSANGSNSSSTHGPAAASLSGPGPTNAAPSSVGPPGNNGTVKIHALGTDPSDRRNVPHPGCDFLVVGFGFDPEQSLSAVIVGHGGPNAGSGTYASGPYAAAGDGTFSLGPLTLPSGMYKLTVDTGMGAGKHKVFKLDCAPATSGSTGGVSSAAPPQQDASVTSVAGVEVEGRSVSAVRAAATATAPEDAHHSGLAFTGITMLAALIGAALLAIGVVITQRARVRRTGLS